MREIVPEPAEKADLNTDVSLLLTVVFELWPHFSSLSQNDEHNAHCGV